MTSGLKTLSFFDHCDFEKIFFRGKRKNEDFFFLHFECDNFWVHPGLIIFILFIALSREQEITRAMMSTPHSLFGDYVTAKILAKKDKNIRLTQEDSWLCTFVDLKMLFLPCHGHWIMRQLFSIPCLHFPSNLPAMLRQNY